MSSALMCDWCRKFAANPMKPDDDHLHYPLGWRIIQWWARERQIASSSQITTHWCGKCDPRKELAVKESGDG